MDIQEKYIASLVLIASIGTVTFAIALIIDVLVGGSNVAVGIAISGGILMLLSVFALLIVVILVPLITIDSKR